MSVIVHVTKSPKGMGLEVPSLAFYWPLSILPVSVLIVTPFEKAPSPFSLAILHITLCPAHLPCL